MMPLRLVHPLPGSCRKKVRKTVCSEMLTKKKRFRICQDEFAKNLMVLSCNIMKSDQISSQQDGSFFLRFKGPTVANRNMMPFGD